MILLDTHCHIWWVTENPRLSKPARDLIYQHLHTDGIGISIISVWETAKLAERKRIVFNIPIEEYLAAAINIEGLRVFELTIPVITDACAFDIAAVYMKEYVMPKGAAGDAFHLACASFHKMDYLLTWNCNHLANANKELHVNVVNGRLGLFAPKITTSLKLFKERD